VLFQSEFIGTYASELAGSQETCAADDIISSIVRRRLKDASQIA
jgi:hypothetical protein